MSDSAYWRVERTSQQLTIVSDKGTFGRGALFVSGCALFLILFFSSIIQSGLTQDALIGGLVLPLILLSAIYLMMPGQLTVTLDFAQGQLTSHRVDFFGLYQRTRRRSLDLAAGVAWDVDQDSCTYLPVIAVLGEEPWPLAITHASQTEYAALINLLGKFADLPLIDKTDLELVRERFSRESYAKTLRNKLPS